MSATTWYEAALVYLRALDIPLDVMGELGDSRVRYPFGCSTAGREEEFRRAARAWLAERRAAREVGE